MSVSLARVTRMARKEMHQMVRDIRMRGVIFVAPIIQLLVFGYAVSTDVREVPTAVVDRDRTSASRELVDRIAASGYFAATRVPGTDLAAALERGEAVIGIEVPSGYAADLASGRGAAVQVLVDGTDSNTGTVALGYLQQIVRRLAIEQGGLGGGIVLATRAWYNPALESRVYNVPAVVGVVLLVVTMLLTSLSVVREREIGTWDQLIVSPVTATELMLGKTVPFAVVGLVDLVLVSVVAVLWFEIPFRGDPLVLLLAAGLFILTGLAVGLLISTVSATQQEAFMTMFLFMMPALIFSGFMFPVSSMPPAFRLVTYLNPVRHFLEVIRSVFLKGGGFGDHPVQLAALGAMAVTALTVAVWRFRAMVGKG